MVDVEGEVDQLRKAIEDLHRCSARLAQSVPVKKTDKGTAVWDGVVHVFDLTGPAATRIYAWSSPIAGTADQRQFFAVLHHGRITSPSDAVRVAIMAERGSQN
jgi:hypothetical protein